MPYKTLHAKPALGFRPCHAINIPNILTMFGHLRGMFTLVGKTSLSKVVLPPLSLGVHSKWKKFATEEHILSFWIRYLKGLEVICYLLSKIWQKIYKVHLFYLNVHGKSK